MNKELMANMALPFSKQGDCFIHTEMRHGKGCETILAGDMQAIMWGIKAELTRWSEKVGCPYHDALGMLAAFGYEKTLGSALGMEGEVKPLNEEYEKDVKQKAKEKAEKDAAGKYREVIDGLIREVDSKDAIIAGLRDRHAREIQQKDTTIKALNKELKDIEHRIDEIVEVRVRAYGSQNAD